MIRLAVVTALLAIPLAARAQALKTEDDKTLYAIGYITGERVGILQLKPNEAKYKVATIVAPDRLRVEAANAFLKTLEEPPANSILILLTTDPQRIPSSPPGSSAPGDTTGSGLPTWR